MAARLTDRGWADTVTGAPAAAVPRRAPLVPAEHVAAELGVTLDELAAIPAARRLAVEDFGGAWMFPPGAAEAIGRATGRTIERAGDDDVAETTEPQAGGTRDR